jgi:hypothetical protein
VTRGKIADGVLTTEPVDVLFKSSYATKDDEPLRKAAQASSSWWRKLVWWR